MAGKDLSQTPIAKLTMGSVGPEDLIAPNFRIYELTRSGDATRLNIDNGFTSDDELRSAVHLARHVLQPLRDAFKAYTPNSVYRSQALDRAIKKMPAGWLSTSQHTQGRACDVEIVGKPTLELAHWIEQNLPEFDQLICECYNPAQGPNSGWVHVSLVPPGMGVNRRQLLSYITDPASGKFVYVQGLRASTA